MAISKLKDFKSIAKRVLALSAGGAVVVFFCYSLAFLFTMNSFQSKLNILWPELGENLTEKIGNHQRTQTLMSYRKHTTADVGLLESYFESIAVDIDLYAVMMTKYMSNPENYKKRIVVTQDPENYSESAVYTEYGPNYSIKDHKLPEELAIANNIKDLMKKSFEMYEWSPVVFYVISKKGYCIHINSGALNLGGKPFSFIDSNRRIKDFDYRSLPTYKMQEESERKAPMSRVLINNGQSVICYSVPYYDKDGFAGVACADISFSDLIKLALHSDETLHDESKSFFMNSEGKIKFSDFESGVFSTGNMSIKQIAESDIKGLVAGMIMGDIGGARVVVDDKEYLVSYAPMAFLDGTFAEVYSADILNDRTSTTRKNLFLLLSEVKTKLTSLLSNYITEGILILIALLIMALLVTFSLVKKVTLPINRISSEIKSLVTGNLDKKIRVKSGDEVENLADNINNMVVEIKKKMQSISDVSSEKGKIEATLNVAKTIQSNMLPMKFDVSAAHDNYSLYAMNLPAKSVGGDFYDLFMIDDDRLVVTIADVSGKGIPAALFMVSSMTILKNISHIMLKNSNDLANVVTQTNIQLCDNNKESMFVTLFTAVINLKTREFTYVSGGHNPPLLLTRGKGSYEYLHTPKVFPMLGVSDMIEYEQNSMILEDGDCLLLYTDGVTEAIDVKENLFGEERLQNIMNEEFMRSSPKKIVKGIYSKILEFAGEAEQFDDITMLCFRFK